MTEREEWEREVEEESRERRWRRDGNSIFTGGQEQSTLVLPTLTILLLATSILNSAPQLVFFFYLFFICFLILFYSFSILFHLFFMYRIYSVECRAQVRSSLRQHHPGR